MSADDSGGPGRGRGEAKGGRDTAGAACASAAVDEAGRGDGCDMLTLCDALHAHEAAT